MFPAATRGTAILARKKAVRPEMVRRAVGVRAVGVRAVGVIVSAVGLALLTGTPGLAAETGEGRGVSAGTYVVNSTLWGQVDGSSLTLAPGLRRDSASELPFAAYAPLSARVQGFDDSRTASGIGLMATARTGFARADGATNANVTYFTPRIAGLQFSASSESAQDGPGLVAPGLAGPALGPRSSAGFNGGLGGRFGGLNRDSYQVGVNYAGDLGPVAIRGSLAATRSAASLYHGAREEVSGLSVGLNFAFGDFTLGGAYGFADGTGLGRPFDLGEPALIPSTAKRSAQSFDLGGTYTMSDWTLGLNYAYGSARYTALGQSGTQIRNPVTNGTEFSFDYALAHGVDLISAVQFINVDAASLVADRPQAKLSANLLVGTQIKF